MSLSSTYPSIRNTIYKSLYPPIYLLTYHPLSRYNIYIYIYIYYG